MGFSAAHMAELGLTQWRLRGSEPPAAAIEPPSVVPEAQLAAPVANAHLESPPPVSVPAPAPAQPAFDIEKRQAELAALDWDGLQAHLRQQPLRAGASQAVFGVGVRDAKVFVVGEAPGAEEDRLGEPFVGRAGQLLDHMLQSIGLSRSRNVYIANICKFHPPANRDPQADEIQQDLPYLLRQIELVQPHILLAVGRIAAQTLLEVDAPLGRLRQQEHVFSSGKLPVVVTYHPAYLLRQPREKAKVWADLKRARAILLRHDD